MREQIRKAFVLLLVLTASAPAGVRNRFRLHPEPRIRVNALQEGPDGLIWIAAEDGLYRFDRFHFQKLAAAPVRRAVALASTSDRSLWVGGDDGLSRYSADGFRLLLREPILGLVGNGQEVFARTTKRLVRVTLRGEIIPIEPAGHYRLACSTSGDLWYFRGRDLHRLLKGANHAELLGQAPNELVGNDLQALPGEGSELWFADGARAFSNKSSGVRYTRDLSTVGWKETPALARGQGANVWFLSRNLARMWPPAEWLRLPRVPSREEVRTGSEDSQGHFWMALPGVGLLEAIEDPNWERFVSSNFKGKSVEQVSRAATGEFLAVTSGDRGRLWRFDESRRLWAILGNEQRSFRSLLPLREGGLLASTGEGTLEVFSANGDAERVVARSSSGFRKLIQDRQGVVWAASSDGLFQVTRIANSYSLKPEQLPIGDLIPDVSDLDLDENGQVWAAGSFGVLWRDEAGNWTSVRLEPPIYDVRSVSVRRRKEIWVTHKGGPKLTKLTLNESGTWTPLDTVSGGVPATAESVFAKTDHRGWIWHGTDTGLWVADGINLGRRDWLRLDTNAGLAGSDFNRYGFLEDSNGSVWLSSAQGITHLKPDLAWFTPRPANVRVTAVDWDQARLERPNLPSEIPSGLPALRIHAGSIQLSSFREPQLLFRLIPGSPVWGSMNEGLAELHNPPDGKYELEIAIAQAQPRAITRYVFRVGNVWWRSRLASLSIALCALLAVGRLCWNQVWCQRLRYRSARGLAHWRSRRSRTVGSMELDDSSQILLDRYELIRRVSIGGFAVVYEARDLSNSELPHVAAKVVRSSAGRVSWLKSRFMHEIMALRALRHPNILPLVDSGVSAEGDFVIITPFLDGSSLRSAIASRTISAELRSDIILQLGDGLGEIHRNGLVHRDLKPENIILSGDPPIPVIIDLGSVGLLSEKGRLATTDVLSGSAGYMAPEQLLHQYGPASDLFSFAVIVLELLIEKRLDHLDTSQNLRSAIQAELTSTLTPNVEEVAGLLHDALQANPALRPKSVEDWARAVTQSLKATV